MLGEADIIKLDYFKSLSPKTQLHCSNSMVIRKYNYTIMLGMGTYVALEMDKMRYVSCNTAL